MRSMRQHNESSKTYINLLSQDSHVQENEPPLRLFLSGTRHDENRGIRTSVKRFDVGFTGTRAGMSDQQRQQIITILKRIKRLYPNAECWAHHGDCDGGDAEFHELAKKAGFLVHGHPPSNNKLRAFCQFDKVNRTQTYTVRNHDIVRASDILIGAPRMPEHDGSQRYSGTWATIRYARRRKKPYIVIDNLGYRKGGNGWKRVLQRRESRS